MLSADEARRLDRLALGTHDSLSPGAAGYRITRSRGFSSEFHDFRHYQPGDDPRSLAWTISARLGQMVVRTYRADATLRVHLLIDVSASMTLAKLECAKRLAALLAYVAVRGGDAAGMATFDDRLRLSIPPDSGRHQLHRVLDTLAATPAGGPSSVSRALMQFGETHRGPGLAVVLSDFFDPAEPWEGLRYLLHRDLTPAVVQIVSDEELDPEVDGSIELVDLEDPQGGAVIVGPEAVDRYRARLDGVTAALGEFCGSHGCPWTRVRASSTFSDLVESCHRAGLLTERM
jgi:uncharacterized protein (DUF58 family)